MSGELKLIVRAAPRPTSARRPLWLPSLAPVLGAALTRGVDIAQQHRADVAKADEDRGRDLDETRQLAYAMLSK